MKSSKAPAAASANPFEAKWAVLSGANRRRSSGATKRSRRNVFADRRIGENDPTLPEDERYLARLQRERTRRTKKRARYSLADDDGELDAQKEEDRQTDKRPFSLLRDDYEESDGAEEEAGDDEGSGDELLTLKRAAGEGDEEDGEDGADVQRTHQEIMQEVVLKSKMYKAKRQQDKHDADEQTAKLDEDLPNIMALLSKSSSDFAKKKAEEKKPAMKKTPVSIFGDAENDAQVVGSTKPPPPPGNDGLFSYERVYRQLAAEKRARPSDRLLTEEEKAEKEIEELEELERMRTERMRNAEDSGDENEGPETSGSRKKKSKRKEKPKKEKRHTGGDDLDDGFDLSEDDEEESGHSGEDEGMVEQGEPDKDSNVDGDASSDGEEEELDPNSLLFLPVQETKESDEDIPYVFKECPSSPAGLQNLFDGRTIAQRKLVIERLRKCFAVSLNPTANKAKLDQLLECLLMRIECLAKVSSQHLQSAMTEIDMLLMHAHALGKKTEALVADWARDRLASAFHALTSLDTSRGLSAVWGVPTLLLLRSIGRLFPSSDLRHPVSTPLVLLLSEALSLPRMVHSDDLAMGTFVAGLLLEQMASSGRYSGQLATFVIGVLCAAYCSGQLKLAGALAEFREEGKKFKAAKLRLADLIHVGERDSLHELVLQAKVVQAAVCLAEAAGMSGRVGHLDIVFARLPLDELPHVASRPKLLETLVSARANRKPLSLYAVSTAAAVRKTLNPKFSAESGVFRRAARTSYHAARSGDMSQSAMRVRRALRKEERGLARDVRQAAASRRGERNRETEERRERGEKRTREALSFLESQQANWKKAEKRQKMLSGKKW